MKLGGAKRVEPITVTCGAKSSASRVAMQFRAISLLLCALIALTPALRATSVVAPTFSELVAEADGIYRGRVTAVEPRRVDRPDGGNVIKTFVTVAVDKVLKGAEKTEVVLEFLGGTIGDERLEVSGMPKFTVGSREIVFVQKNGTQFCPLVGMMHGRYKVMRDPARATEFIVRDNGMPLTDVEEVALPMTNLPAPVGAAAASAARARALSPENFEANISTQVKRMPSQR